MEHVYCDTGQSSIAKGRDACKAIRTPFIDLDPYMTVNGGIRTKTRSVIGVCVFFILLACVALSGCSSPSSVLNESDSEMHLSYTLSIENSTGVDRYVLLPVPLKEDGNISDLVNGLKKKAGTGDFTYVDTPYGPAINITLSTTLTLWYHKDSTSLDVYWFEQFSMQNMSRFPGHYHGSEFFNEDYHSYVSSLTGTEVLSVVIEGKVSTVTGTTEAHSKNRDSTLAGTLCEPGWSLALEGRNSYSESA